MSTALAKMRRGRRAPTSRPTRRRPCAARRFCRCCSSWRSIFANCSGAAIDLDDARDLVAALKRDVQVHRRSRR